MSGLTNAEIVALGNAVLIDERGVAVGFDHAAVEQIIARHVAAALTEAADAIEEARDTHVYMCRCTECRITERAAHIVRNLAKPT